MGHRQFVRKLARWQDPEARAFLLSPLPASRELAPSEWDFKVEFWTSTLPQYMQARYAFSATGRELSRCFKCDMRTVGIAMQYLSKAGRAAAAKGGVEDGRRMALFQPGVLSKLRALPLPDAVALDPGTRWVFTGVLHGAVAEIVAFLRESYSTSVFTPDELIVCLQEKGLDRWIADKPWNVRCIETAPDGGLEAMRDESGKLRGWRISRKVRTVKS